MARAVTGMGIMVAAGLIAMTIVGTTLASGSDLTAERRADLMNLLIQDCGSCHGLTMKGGLGSPLLPSNLDGVDPETLAVIILDGVPNTPMPPWRGQLTEPEAMWMAKQLKKGLE